mmetsp:Transcript_25035/g.72421  ORF Transcript_25035/g.72421 Transcript_25035/m.72421 type:complete len:434 (-) Transcript_25035:135-1436(-)
MWRSLLLIAFLLGALLPLLHVASSTSSAGDEATRHQTTFELVLLTDAATTKGAVCLDGSPGGYYLRRPLVATANSSKFLVFHEGGGWCGSDANCLDRSLTPLGSSLGYEPTISGDGGGIEAVALYASLRDYTIVYAKYCDGTSWSGNVGEPIRVRNETSGRNETIFYRGRRLLDALMDDLLQNQGLDEADVVLYGGCSAGSLTTYLHIDYLRTKLSPSTKLAGLGDSMYALPYKGYKSPVNHFQQMLQWGYTAWNSSASINDRCREHYAQRMRPQDAFLCLYGSIVVNFVRVPMLIVNSKFDTWQQKAILGLDGDYCSPKVDMDGTVIPCGNDSPGAQARDRYWKIYASVMQRTVEELLPPRHGVFLTNCPWHCLFGWMNWYDSAGSDQQLNVATAHWIALLESGRIHENMTAPRWIAKEQDKCFGQKMGAHA